MEGRDGERASSLAQGRDIDGTFPIKPMLKIFIQNENSSWFFIPEWLEWSLQAAGMPWLSQPLLLARPLPSSGRAPVLGCAFQCHSAQPRQPCWASIADLVISTCFMGTFPCAGRAQEPLGTRGMSLGMGDEFGT